jgi:hypothetical protein
MPPRPSNPRMMYPAKVAPLANGMRGYYLRGRDLAFQPIRRCGATRAERLRTSAVSAPLQPIGQRATGVQDVSFGDGACPLDVFVTECVEQLLVFVE